MDNIIEMLKKALTAVGLRKRRRPKAFSINRSRGG
jgi:hypothetical protein